MLIDAPTLTALTGLVVAITALVKIFQAESQRTAQTRAINAAHRTTLHTQAAVEVVAHQTNGTLTTLMDENAKLRATQATPAELVARTAPGGPGQAQDTPQGPAATHP